ncbi:MAG: 16S rRNA (guanine(527)-N(7))-methyltransferase RsmG [Bdellovibrionaceae bacterium]|nr:16S rRNA (guanine(527)-N(7))-methyltransferase RsmG [Pseudobdellovibrionaceae bacterium]
MRRYSKKSQAPSAESLNQILSQSGIRLSRGQLDQLWRYHNLLRKRNQDRDLTRLIGFETIAVKHYVDCLLIPKMVRLEGPLLDVGTGAGFPGIPLKIFLPKLHIILAEPRPRRVAFLEEAIELLGLKGIEVFPHKVVSRSFQKPVRGVITRALETMDKTFLRTSGCLLPGGKIYFMKGPNVDEEIGEVRTRFAKEFRLSGDKAYNLPRTPHQRRLVTWEKIDAV